MPAGTAPPSSRPGSRSPSRRSSRRSRASRSPGHMLEHVLIGDAAVALLVLAVPRAAALLPAAAARRALGRAPRAAAARRRRAGAPVGRARGVGLRLRRLAHPDGLRLRRRARARARRRAPLASWRPASSSGRSSSTRPAAARSRSAGRLAFAGALFAFGQVLSDVLLLAPEPLYPAYGDGTAALHDQQLAGLVMMAEQLRDARRLRRAARALVDARHRGAGPRLGRAAKYGRGRAADPAGEPAATSRASRSRTARCGATSALLGALLGQVLVEQEGEEFLAAEEHVRAAARQSREVGDPAIVREAVRALAPDDQAKMLRAFALYFQLANAAEQHHRIRRRREDEHAGLVTRESLEEAFELLADVPEDELHDAARATSRSSSCSPRTRPRRRGARCCRRTSASPRCSTALDDPMLTPRERDGDRRRPRRGDHGPVADRRGARRAAARDRRDPPRPLVLRGEPARRGRGAVRRVPRAASPTRRRRSRSAPGSAATSTATRRSAGRRSRRRSQRSRELALAPLPAGDPRARRRDRVEPLAHPRLARARRVDRARRARAAALRRRDPPPEHLRAVPPQALVHVGADRRGRVPRARELLADLA